MFSFSSPFCISSERIEECAAKNSVPGFEIPGLAEVSNLLQAPEPDVDAVREKLCQGCGSLLNTVANKEFRSFFAEILSLLEEQGSRVYLQAVRKDACFADDEFFALPFLVADFYRLAAERFSGGSLYTLFETEVSRSLAWAFVDSLDMPEILKKFFAGFCGDEFMFENKSLSLRKILPNSGE
jgi:hypothetical protein